MFLQRAVRVVSRTLLAFVEVSIFALCPEAQFQTSEARKRKRDGDAIAEVLLSVSISTGVLRIENTEKYFVVLGRGSSAVATAIETGRLTTDVYTQELIPSWDIPWQDVKEAPIDVNDGGHIDAATCIGDETRNFALLLFTSSALSTVARVHTIASTQVR